MTGAGTLSNHTPTSVMYTAPASVSSTTSATITAASVAQPAVTALVTLTINPPPGPLTVTTTSLPDGTMGLPYAATLEASGGSSPYTWSISSGSLPIGAGLGWPSTSPNTAVIDGTPDAAGTASFTVQVTDSATPPAIATQALTLTVAQPDSTNNAALKGQYAFQLQGFDNSNWKPFAMVGSFIADGNGNITSGIEDINGPDGYQEEVAFTGTYNVGSDNRGFVTFTTSLGSTRFALAVGSL